MSLVLHNLGTAVHVIVIDRYLLAYILLGYSQFLLYAKFNRQSVGVPSGLTVNLIAAHGLVAAECVLYGTGHNVVDTWHSVSRGRSLVEHE